MNKVIEFSIFCLESYKQAHELTGKQVIALFSEKKIFDYIESFYDILHSTGQKYIVEDIDVYLRSRKAG
jgi:hypothetical protein